VNILLRKSEIIMEKKLKLSNLYFENYRNLVAEDGLKLNNIE
jgi:hypothetical protein